MWFLLDYVMELLANAPKIHMCAEVGLSSFAASVRSKEPRSLELLRSSPAVPNFVLKKYASDSRIAMKNVANLRYIQLSSMTPQQYTEELVAISSKVSDMSDESTFNDVFIEGVDASIRNNIHIYWQKNSQADLTDITLAQSLLSAK